MADAAYLHGFDPSEQVRLAEQGAYLAPWMYEGLTLPAAGRLLEIGAGVGAQTVQLLQRCGAQLVALEREPRQLAAWKSAVSGIASSRDRAMPLVGDGRSLPFQSGSLDGAFLSWVLEHVPRAEEVLVEAHRALKPGAPIVAIEVQNQSLTVWPPTPVIHRYWEAVNQTQREMGGDPYVGVRLGSMLKQAGFVASHVEWVAIHADARDVPRRNQIFGYFHRLLLSSLPSVKAAGRGWPGIESELGAGFEALVANPASAFLYTFARATARKGG